jgi:ABC-type branched-subunit amino acid transport system permease subunit
MTIRARGLLLFLGSLVAGLGAYALIFRVLSKNWADMLQYPLALPLVGVLVGALEFVTGVPINRLDEGWQKVPVYVRAPVSLIGALLFLWGLVKLLGF